MIGYGFPNTQLPFSIVKIVIILIMLQNVVLWRHRTYNVIFLLQLSFTLLSLPQKYFWLKRWNMSCTSLPSIMPKCCGNQIKAGKKLIVKKKKTDRNIKNIWNATLSNSCQHADIQFLLNFIVYFVYFSLSTCTDITVLLTVNTFWYIGIIITMKCINMANIRKNSLLCWSVILH